MNAFAAALTGVRTYDDPRAEAQRLREQVAPVLEGLRTDRGPVRVNQLADEVVVAVESGNDSIGHVRVGVSSTGFHYDFGQNRLRDPEEALAALGRLVALKAFRYAE